MSWLFSQALVKEYLGDTSLDGEQSALLSGKPTQLAYCAPDKMTDFSRLSRFGMMFKPLTEILGEELLMSYLAGFHAKTLAQPEKEKALGGVEAQCGNTWRELLAKYDPDTHSWKTAQCSLLEDSEQSLQTWPRWGSMRNGECYRQPMLAQTISGKECGLWLTPATVDIPTRSEESMRRRLEYRKNIGRSGVGAGCLAEQVTWSGIGPPISYMKAENWPTPTANMHKGSSPVVIRKDGQDRSWGSLHYAVEQVTNIGGKLNPMWVEWLMGWPLGWTDLKPLEMDKSHFVPQQLGSC
jgi:hypothetical protein